ncbi:MAG: hypothetical protein R3B48_13100 [Kofleriaceae bacterium]
MSDPAIFMSLDASSLELVAGGQNTTTVRNSQGERSTNRTDYAYCTDKVTQACNTANPGMLWGTNETKAAQCTLQNLPVACGQPPTPGSPQ